MQNIQVKKHLKVEFIIFATTDSFRKIHLQN